MTINILCRTSYRPKAFKRMLDSILSQTYNDIRIIVSYDDKRALKYIPSGIEAIRLTKDHKKPYFFDNYCNDLKHMVNEGYFFFLDDSDYLSSSNVISDLVGQLKGTGGVICQFKRKDRLKPSNELIHRKEIIMGKIGMPCLVLHHSHKDVAYLDGSVNAADYHWIKAVSEKIELKFIQLALVTAERRDRGRME